MTIPALPGLAMASAAEAATEADPAQAIIVSGKHAESPSREVQQDAPNLIQSITQGEARRLPDLNAGEAIARLPGASLAVDTGQGRWVNIRGLDADLTTTTYGGIHLPPTNPVTPQNGGRAFAFDAFPTGMIGAMTITKTNRPDQDAEALGGTIEITPMAIPAGRNHFFDLHLGSGVQFSRGTGIVDLSASGGFRFGGSGDDKPFSVVASLTYYKDALGNDDRRASFADSASQPNLAWSSYTQGYYRFHRTTKGGAVEAAYDPNPDTHLFVRYLRTGYDEQVDRDRLVIKTTGTATQSADGSITSSVKQFDKSVRDMLEQVSLDVFTAGGHNRIGDLRLDYHGSYAQGRDYRPYDTITTFTSKPTGASFTYNQCNYNYPTWSTSGANPADTSGYALSGVTNNTQLYRTREWAGGLDATLPTHFLGGDKHEELKAGVAFRRRTNTHVYNPYTSTAVPGAALSSYVEPGQTYYYQNHYPDGPNISIPAVRALWANGTGTGFATNAAANSFGGLAVQQDNREDVYAGYVQGQVKLGRLGLIAGLRVEHTDAVYSGNTTVPTNSTSATTDRGGQTATYNGSTLIPVTSKASYTNLFPSVQARFEVKKDLVLRASYSSTIARPGFNQVDPAATIDTANNIVTSGNPNLKPITSQNFDLSVEQYLPQGGIISLGLFDKELSNYIFGRTVYGGITDPVVLNALGPQSTPTQVVTYSNISHAHARGFELNYDQHLSFLPGPLGHFGVSANYTYVDSKAQIRAGEDAMLPSTSKNNYNAALYWDDGKFNMRGAVTYVGRSLLYVSTSRALDQYTEARLSADVSVSYAFTDKVSIYAAGRNLLNTAHTLTEGASSRVIQREMFGSSLLAGFNIKF
ncbi:TonB-dependent receptor [Novosphingobium terrae]|uniref:TonB-dependent receptor n=1 Tax=Novosphingobium terrae TaxID=2726189 RepID=UPI00198081CC|nr:TonB-dependent receptor [Novosphingobium terrae]